MQIKAIIQFIVLIKICAGERILKGLYNPTTDYNYQHESTGNFYLFCYFNRFLFLELFFSIFYYESINY